MPNEVKLLPCPFCGVSPRDGMNGRTCYHPQNNCTLDGWHFNIPNWQSRPTTVVTDEVVERDEPDFGESFSEHQGVTLSCRNVAPGLTLHDLAVAFENAKRKAKPGDEVAGDPSKWPDVRGINAVVDAINAAYAALASMPTVVTGEQAQGLGECHGLDTPERVCFYEQDFYVLSNFSAFSVMWEGLRFDTSEHLYHWLKFATTPNGVGLGLAPIVAHEILNAPSAHEAFKVAERNRDQRRHDWDDVKVAFMRDILWAKALQHEYVRRKLLATGNRELVENSWRDDYWGWGPNREGQNMLGKLWMEIRSELAPAQPGDA